MVSQLGRSFSWSSSRGHSSRGDVEVAVSVRGGRTRIAVQESLGPLAGAVFGGIGGGMGGGGLRPIIGRIPRRLHRHRAQIFPGVPPLASASLLTPRPVLNPLSPRPEAGAAGPPRPPA